MMRFVLAAALGVAAFTLAGVTTNNVRAEDKKNDKAKTLEGTLTCTKCALSETKQCGHALIVKDGDKKVTYYLVDKGGKEPYHKNCCTADVAGVKVTGVVVEKDKKQTITDPKVELPK
ncbi:MAG: hypothetical protein K8U57_06205 [Planctomycetes bacterium]|nr:hypothetical protein [Planctomycetota bacterium]